MKKFALEVARMVCAMLSILLIITVTTWSTNKARVAEYQRLEAKLDALVEYSGLEWAEVINAEHE